MLSITLFFYFIKSWRFLSGKANWSGSPLSIPMVESEWSLKQSSSRRKLWWIQCRGSTSGRKCSAVDLPHKRTQLKILRLCRILLYSTFSYSIFEITQNSMATSKHPPSFEYLTENVFAPIRVFSTRYYIISARSTTVV